MFSNISASSSVPNEKSSLRSVYEKLRNFVGRGSASGSLKQDMLSSRESTKASDDSFITPVSSSGDLMAMSPKRSKDMDLSADFITGAEGICDVTMQEAPVYNDIDNLFNDAESLNYLMKCAESKHNKNFVDRGKESLFVKFDPLYSTQKLESACSTHTESVADSLEHDVGYDTGSAMSVFTDNVVATPQHSMSAGSMPSFNKDKPTQVVPPVVSCEVPKSSTSYIRSTPALVRSISAILTPSQVATESLISITPPVAAPRSPRFDQYSSHQTDRLQSLRVMLEKQDQEVLLLRQENRELRSSLQDLEHKHARSMEDLEYKLKKITDERDSLLERENKLLQQVNEKVLSNKQMSIVMEEYEKTLYSLITEQQREKVEVREMQEKLTFERDQALHHLENMESSFNDLLARYEKSKSIVLQAKEREMSFIEKTAEYENGLKKYEEVYNKLKQVTSESLAEANEKLENINKNHTVEIAKLQAAIKKNEMTISSLQESLIQKTRDNEELSKICDQLINDVR